MRTRGGKHNPLSKLQRRQLAYDSLPATAPPGGGASKQTYKRPGSNNDHKQS